MAAFLILLLGASLGLVGKGAAGLGRFPAGKATGGFGSMGGVGSGSTWLVVVAVVMPGGSCSASGAGITAGLRSLGGVGTKGKKNS